MHLGITEILVILAIALVVFGGGKLSGVGKAIGQSIREFRKEVKPEDKEKAEKAAQEEKKETEGQ